MQLICFFSWPVHPEWERLTPGLFLFFPLNIFLSASDNL
jgi:hypothetical protein